MAGRDEQLVALRHPSIDLEVTVRPRLAAVLRQYGYTDVAPHPQGEGEQPLNTNVGKPADELPEMSEIEEKRR